MKVGVAREPGTRAPSPVGTKQLDRAVYHFILVPIEVHHRMHRHPLGPGRKAAQGKLANAVSAVVVDAERLRLDPCVVRAARVLGDARPHCLGLLKQFLKLLLNLILILPLVETKGFLSELAADSVAVVFTDIHEATRERPTAAIASQDHDDLEQWFPTTQHARAIRAALPSRNNGVGCVVRPPSAKL